MINLYTNRQYLCSDIEYKLSNKKMFSCIEEYNMRIKLPGSMKTKIILLIILVLLSIGIFIKEGIQNSKHTDSTVTTENQTIKSK